MVNVGVIGIGGMGRMHFNCYQNNPQAKVVAIADVDQRKLEGDWSSIGLNIDTSETARVDLTGIKTYASADALLADQDVHVVSICLPTNLHAEVAIAALKAGKHVLCEKPMAGRVSDCQDMAAAARETGKQLMLGHCLRYWPQYVKAHELISGGTYGKTRYARFHRSSATPLWSWDSWLTDGDRSGGAVLDMHIHDVDTALWWFGTPARIDADGTFIGNMPATVDATWRYNDGPLVYLHGSWDNNGGPFRMSFKVVLERASIVWDSSVGPKMQLHTAEGTEEIEVPDTLAYQAEVDDFIACVAAGRPVERVTPASSLESVAAVIEELSQMRVKGI
jgi:predicted dehydrogenase